MPYYINIVKELFIMRQQLKQKTKKETSNFRLRGMEHTRIEGLSDGVFAIAIALLLISSDVPERFNELLAFLKDFVPFGATIVLLMVIWYQHYIFFIRYGLRDSNIVALNTLVLFLILFYVYPLKFLFNILYTLFGGLITGNEQALRILFTETMPADDGPTLMVIYGFGAASIFVSLALLYAYALKKRNFLVLTAYELFETKSSLFTNLILASIPLLSALIAALHVGGRNAFMISGFTYFLYPVIMPLYGILREKQRKRFIAQANAS